jgi:hypothetical protein
MPARTRVSFATCNLYNINRPGLSIYADRDGWDQETYDRKVVWTAATIATVHADVWGFQELWHADALADVFTAAGLGDSNALLVPEGHAGGAIVCAGAVREDILVG